MMNIFDKFITSQKNLCCKNCLLCEYELDGDDDYYWCRKDLAQDLENPDTLGCLTGVWLYADNSERSLGFATIPEMCNFMLTVGYDIHIVPRVAWREED